MSFDQQLADSYLYDAVEQIQMIKQYTDDLTGETFLGDQKAIDAVTLRFLYLGEAVRRVRDLNENYLSNEVSSEIAWDDIIAMRNVLAHDYENVRAEIIWRAQDTYMDQLLMVCETHLGMEHGLDID